MNCYILFALLKKLLSPGCSEFRSMFLHEYCIIYAVKSKTTHNAVCSHGKCIQNGPQSETIVWLHFTTINGCVLCRHPADNHSVASVWFSIRDDIIYAQCNLVNVLFYYIVMQYNIGLYKMGFQRNTLPACLLFYICKVSQLRNLGGVPDRITKWIFYDFASVISGKSDSIFVEYVYKDIIHFNVIIQLVVEDNWIGTYIFDICNVSPKLKKMRHISHHLCFFYIAQQQKTEGCVELLNRKIYNFKGVITTSKHSMETRCTLPNIIYYSIEACYCKTKQF